MIIVNNRDKIEWHKGITVRDVLNAMGYDFPVIAISVNNEYISPDDFDSFTVPDSADFKAIHIMHGG